MGLGDEYSRDALFRRPDQDAHTSDSDCEESPEPLHPEDWEALFSDQIYTDVVLTQQFVSDNCFRARNRYGVPESTKVLPETATSCSDWVCSIEAMRPWCRPHFQATFNPPNLPIRVKMFFQPT